jgi:hypothetical protein
MFVSMTQDTITLQLQRGSGNTFYHSPDVSAFSSEPQDSCLEQTFKSQHFLKESKHILRIL